VVKKQYFTHSLRSFVKYWFYHSKIKFISSRRRVISSIYYTLKAMSIGFLQEHKFLAVTISLKSLTFHCLPVDSTSLSTSFVKFFSPVNKIILRFTKLGYITFSVVLLTDERQLRAETTKLPQTVSYALLIVLQYKR